MDNKELPPKEALEALRTWQTEQKAKKPINSEVEEARKELVNAEAELTAYKNREATIKVAHYLLLNFSFYLPL